MAARFILALCASALLVQSISGCPTCSYNSYGVNAGSLANAGALANAAAIANAGAINNAAAINAAAYNSAASINAAANSAAAINAAELAADIAVANSIGFGNGFGLGYSTLPYVAGPVYTNLPVASSSGGPFSVTINSAYAPTGLSVVSENTIEGVLDVIGSLPVFAAVALDGNVLSTGAAGTSYSCGNGNVGISSESLAAAGLGYGSAIANNAARAEIAGAQLTNAAGYNAALAGELAAVSGLAAYPQSALYGSAGLNAAALSQAELASITGLGFNTGLGAITGFGVNAGLGYLPRPCAC
ncbi:hypothetical protein O0L34_g13229 [Tuta absoluta]|nr:hypothetical protein O0L34_g13229 [Tuta absoluta]